MRSPQEHLYDGHRVIEIARRTVAGGVVVDVRKHPKETRWPWTVTEFTTALANLRPLVLLALLALCLAACGPDDASVCVDLVADAGPDATVDAGRNTGPLNDASAEELCMKYGCDAAPVVPVNGLWRSTVLTQECLGIGTPGPLPVRYQFAPHAAFIVFSNGYSDATDWGQIDGASLWTGERTVTDGWTLAPTIWERSGDTLRGTVNLYRTTPSPSASCTYETLLLLEETI